MAGKKKATKGEAKDGLHLPKRIAGVKLPKEARRKLDLLAKHPIVADILAAGLVALAARLKKDPKIQKATADAGAAAGDTAKQAGEQLAQVAADAAVAIAAPLVKRVRQSSTTAAAAPSTPRGKPAAAKPAATKPASRSKSASTSSAKPKAKAAPAKPRAARRASAAKPAAKAPAKSE